VEDAQVESWARSWLAWLAVGLRFLTLTLHFTTGQTVMHQEITALRPGQFHIFTRPSFIRDRQERWLAWFDKYLKPQK
jgi:hypothetical protein